MASLMSHLSLHPSKSSNICSFSSRISPTLALRTSQPVFLSSLNSSEKKRPVEFSGKKLRYCGWNQLLRRRCSVEIPVVNAAASADGADREIEGSAITEAPKSFTGFFFFTWYCLNVVFNILNKKVYNYFPYPYFVSVVHLLVGVTYCLISWSIGLPKRAPINKDLLGVLTPVAACHALGHVMSNVSFAAVAVSFTHTIKALEPFFSAAASQFVLGHQLPLSLWMSLAPVVIGVSMASLTELSFNWLGFTSAMISNISFTYRSIYSKKAMTGMDSTNVYAYISIIALLFCLPPAILIEGPKLCLEAVIKELVFA